jgi:hypothetical protein
MIKPGTYFKPALVLCDDENVKFLSGLQSAASENV